MVPVLVMVHTHQVQEDPEAGLQVVVLEQIAEVAEAVVAVKVKAQVAVEQVL